MQQTILYVLAATVIALLVGWGVARYRAWRQRKRLLGSTLNSAQRALLEAHVPLYGKVPAAMRPALEGAIINFFAEKVFVGCNGFEITDEVRLTIAGNACLLVMAREKRYFPGFETILVYPDTYIATQRSYDGLVVAQENSTRLGESWHRGPIVLSWTDVAEGSANIEDGHNVVLHEFAHKLDEENTVMDGLPVLRNPEDYKIWTEVLTSEFAAFKDRVAERSNTVIDSYGAVSAPEFFAVVTESFFEKGTLMKARLPELYSQLSNFYGLDPAAWQQAH